MSLKSFMESALSEFEKDHGSQTVTIGGSHLPCIPSSENTTAELEVDGFEVQIDLTFLVRKALLSARPKRGALISYKGRDYRIVRTTEPASGSHWEIAVRDPNQA